MILLSTFNSYALNVSANFEWYYHIAYGNCFKFNSQPQDDGSYRQQEIVDKGLVAVLFAGFPQLYFNYLFANPSIGFNVLVEDQDSFPILKEGIFIQPGRNTKISFQRVETEIQPVPYSVCMDADSVDTIISREMARLGLKYNRRNCLELVKVKIGMDLIGCYDMRYPRILNATPCDNVTSYVRFLNMPPYNFTNYYQFCPYECASVSFNMVISQQDFPSFNFFETQMYELGAFYNDLFQGDTVTYDMFQQSFAYLTIQVEDLKVQHISESPSNTVADLLAGLGGTFGLFIGVSVLSIVELFELIFFILISIKV
jgi:hypothetical protein